MSIAPQPLSPPIRHTAPARKTPRHNAEIRIIFYNRRKRNQNISISQNDHYPTMRKSRILHTPPAFRSNSKHPLNTTQSFSNLRTITMAYIALNSVRLDSKSSHGNTQRRNTTIWAH